MNLDKVEHNSSTYHVLRAYVQWFHNGLFYRKIETTGLTKLKERKAGIIAPNHQNALMDPLAILFSKRESVAFVARADIFAKPIIINFFLFAKMLPIYRIRDGKKSLALNEKIFAKSVELIESKIPLTIFPEATHSPIRSLLPLKKGIFRVAFAAEEKNNFKLDSFVYPVGINYSNYFNYRTDLLVNYGKPIALKNYQEEYEENAPRAMQHIRKDLTSEMKKLAIHIKNKEYYDFYESSREVFDYEAKNILGLENNKSLSAKFIADKFIIRTLDDEFENHPENFIQIKDKLTHYREKLSKGKVKDWLFDKPLSLTKTILHSILGLILFPFFLLAVLNTGIPIYLPELLLPKFNDKQFYSSVRFVGSLVSVHLFGLFIFILLWIFVDDWWIKWLFLSLQAPLFILFFWYRQKFTKIIGKWHYFFNKQLRLSLIAEKKELIQMFHFIVERKTSI